MSGRGSRRRRRIQRQGLRGLHPPEYEIVGECSGQTRNELIEAIRAALRHARAERVAAKAEKERAERMAAQQGTRGADGCAAGRDVMRQDPHIWGRYFSQAAVMTKPLRAPTYECVGDESGDTYPAILRAIRSPGDAASICVRCATRYYTSLPQCCVCKDTICAWCSKKGECFDEATGTFVHTQLRHQSRHAHTREV